MKPAPDDETDFGGSLRADAMAIFRAGINAVRAGRLVVEKLRVTGGELQIGHERIELAGIKRVVIVGAGKASGEMAAGAIDAIAPHLRPNQVLTGWVNVPEGVGAQTVPIRIFEARPQSENLPTENVLAGTREIIRLIESLTDDDLCLCLISGGGSALLALPAEGISLADKRAISKLLSSKKASIQQLNRVRRQLSQVKGGRLLKHHRAGRFITLIISDILGDPIDLIASGPTVISDNDSPQSALDVFRELQIGGDAIPVSVLQHLEREAARNQNAARSNSPTLKKVANIVIGNIEVAIAAAAVEAKRLGYECQTEIQLAPDLLADDEGQRFAGDIRRLQALPGKQCLISGGEPVVRLCQHPGQGGRNQQLVLVATKVILDQPMRSPQENGFCLLSAGTDGEDGNVPVAGALVDDHLIAESRARRIDPTPYIATNDAFSFFSQLDGSVVTGPTGTNVCDLRIVLSDNYDSAKPS